MLSHLHAIELRLNHEKDRLAQAKKPKEIELRKVWVAACEKELADEIKFLESKGVKVRKSREDLEAELLDLDALVTELTAGA